MQTEGLSRVENYAVYKRLLNLTTLANIVESSGIG